MEGFLIPHLYSLSMLPFQVKYLPEKEEWFVVGEHGVIGTSSTKKKAKRKALGEAQKVADRNNVTVAVNIHGQDNRYQRTEKVSPSP